MAKKKEKPLTREDVLKLIEENGRTAKGLDLSGKVFEEGIDLRGLNLNGIILNGARFPDKYQETEHKIFVQPAQLQFVDLQGAQLKEAVLAGVHLQGAKLMRAQLQKAHLILANLQGATLRWAELYGTDLSDTQLQGTDLYKSKLEGAYLHRAKFSSDTRLEDADWGSYILGEETKGLFDLATATYRQLKVWYANAGISDIAAKFYYREKEVNRKSLKWYSRHRLALEFFRALFGYGEEWKRVLYWIVVVILSFAAAYYFWGSFTSSSFWDTLYYSAASFTALGYGNWAPQPTGWAKGMGAAEAIIGVFMMALLLVTFVRKWTR